MKPKHSISAGLLLFVFLVACTGIQTGAKTKPMYLYYNFSYGARALSMGNAYTAAADDLTAIYWNPANVGLQTGPQVYFNFRSDKLQYSHNTETDNTGIYPRTYSYNLDMKLKEIDFFSISAPVIFWDVKWNFALSYYRMIPYGFSGESLGQSITKGTDFTSTENTWWEIKGKNGIDVLAFTGAFDLIDSVAFGITYQRYFNSGNISYSFTGPEAVYKQDYSEKTDGWNAILGLLFKLNKDFLLGVTYQTRYKGTLASDYTYQDISGGGSPVMTSTNANLVLPPRLSTGIMMRPFKRLTLSVDYSILYWSKATLSNYFGSTATLPYPGRDDITFSQKDNVNIRTGMEINIPVKKFIIFIRAGLSKERQLFVNASNGFVKVNGLSLGLGVDVSSRFKLDLAYMSQKSNWTEASYFNSLNTIDTSLKNKTFALSISYNFGKPETTGN